MGHTVEKIGGTSMSRVHELRDTVLIADAGAYGFVMANTYNLRGLPREDAIE